MPRPGQSRPPEQPQLQAATELPPQFEPGGLVREEARIGGVAALKFADLYRLDDQPLGEGRYSRVYVATHLVTGAKRAVKTALRRGPSSKIVDLGMECPGRLARHEADILKTLDHPNVVRLYEVYEEKEAVHLVLELCEGSDVLERILVSKGRLPEPEISLLFVQMLFAVWHLHSRGVIHRDLKPEHFLFTRREPEREPHPPKMASLKVIDFGLSHKEGFAFTPFGGTPQFLPPEIVVGQASKRELADRVDMWALGVVLHAMLVGHYPSPHLKDSTQAQYFGKSAWGSISKECIDLLGLLLRQAPSARLSSGLALRHPWAQRTIAARGEVPEALVFSFPSFVSAYGQAPGLQKLALLATAHELDDFGYYGLKILFQAMLLQSPEGKLTRGDLEQMAVFPNTVGKAAAAIIRSFESRSAAGEVATWTEFLALATLGSLQNQPLTLSSTSANGSRAPQAPSAAGGAATGLPTLSEDACWRAFDTLSLSQGEITPQSLESLLSALQVSGPSMAANGAQQRVAPTSSSATTKLTGTHSGGGGRPADGEGLGPLVRELFPGGAVRRENFLNLLEGKVQRGQRRNTGGAIVAIWGSLASMLRCFRRPRQPPPPAPKLPGGLQSLHSV